LATGPTLTQAWKSASARLAAAGVESPTLDSRLLLEAAAQVRRADILADPQRPLGAEALGRLEGFLERRSRREPVSRILGRKAFWTLELEVGPGVLSPRPDSETILDLVLAEFGPEAAFEVLDLGVGSGALLLAILAERPLARGLGVDVSDEALATAQRNVARLGLGERAALRRGDWTLGLDDEAFDLVVANPPYVASADIETLAPEVRDYEPRLALDGGPDGLDAYRRLAPEILRVLRRGGRFVVEIGAAQREAVEALFLAAGAQQVTARRDLANRERVVAGYKKALGN
jgi:release factor glutamine methyltransferase